MEACQPQGTSQLDTRAITLVKCQSDIGVANFTLSTASLVQVAVQHTFFAILMTPRVCSAVAICLALSLTICTAAPSASSLALISLHPV